MIERRGEVWWADLGEPHGSAPAGRRPVLVVSADSYNGSGIATVVCLVITSNQRRAEQPGNVVVEPKPGTGLTKRSVVNVSQVVTLDRSDLTDVAGALSAATMRQVDAGLRLVLGLGGKT